MKGSGFVLPDLFPSLQIRSATKAFWRDVYDLMKDNDMSEAEALQMLDRTGWKRARYPRPENFPDCFVQNSKA